MTISEKYLKNKYDDEKMIKEIWKVVFGNNECTECKLSLLEVVNIMSKDLEVE